MPDGRVFNPATQQWEMPTAAPVAPPAPPASPVPPPPSATAIGAAPGYGAPVAPQYAAPAPVAAPVQQQDTMAGRCKLDVRLSWFFVLRRDNKGKQRVTLLIPKSDANTRALMDAKVQEGLRKKWAQPPQYYSTPIKDGDTWRNPDNGKPLGDECKGHWVINAVGNDKYPVRVLDIYGNEITDPRAVKSGDYARVSVTFYGNDKENKIGVFCALNTVVFMREGEALGGDSSVSAEQEFAGDFQAPPPGYVPPPRYNPPQAGAPSAPPPQAPVTATAGNFAPPPAPPGYGAPGATTAPQIAVPAAPVPAPAPYSPPVVQTQPVVQLSPDGKFAWNGQQWVPNDTVHPQHIPY